MQSQGIIISSLKKRLQSQKIIETHGSIVFLTASKAYKLKKAVNFPYMDYSTLELREKFCKREIALNSQTAPQIYERAVPVVRAIDGDLRIGGEGQVVDWLVEMKRFKDEALLDCVVAQKKISTKLERQLAERIADFHRRAIAIHDKNGLDIILHIIDLNAKQLEILSNQDSIYINWNKSLAKNLIHWTDKLSCLLQERGKEGFIRRCHGDLNLHNICIWQGEPLLFDRVEFNNDFTDIDILYDLAFLLMDLDSRSHQSVRNSILELYFQYTDASTGIELLPLFCSIRAMVKAHTTVATACMNSNRISRSKQLRTADQYLHLAASYLMS